MKKNNKTKKILNSKIAIIILMSIIAILVIVFDTKTIYAANSFEDFDLSSSERKTLGSGKKHIGVILNNFNFSKLTGYGRSINTYCIAHSKAMHGNIDMKCRTYIEIIGDYAYVYTSSGAEGVRYGPNNVFGEFAYVSSRKTGYGSSVSSPEPGQQLIWHWFNEFAEKIGQSDWKDSHNSDQYIKGIKSEKTQNLRKEAKDYADDIRFYNPDKESSQTQISKATDKTDKDNLKIKNSGNVVLAGPVKWAFTGKMNEFNIKVNGDKTNIYKETTNGYKKIDPKDLKSGDEFWVEVKGINQPKEIKINLDFKTKGNKEKVELYKTHIWLFKSENEYMQNIMHVNNDTEEIKTSQTGEGEYKIKPEGEYRLFIEKDDAAGKAIKRNKAKFDIELAGIPDNMNGWSDLETDKNGLLDVTYWYSSLTDKKYCVDKGVRKITEDNYKDKDVYTIEETSAPKNYQKFDGKIQIIVKKEYNKEKFKFQVKKDGISYKIYNEQGKDVTEENKNVVTIDYKDNKITVHVKNTQPDLYKIVLEKKDEHGKPMTKDTTFFVTGNVIKDKYYTINGSTTIASTKINKKNVDQQDTYTITETNPPSKYKKFEGSISVTIDKEYVDGKYKIKGQPNVTITGDASKVSYQYEAKTMTLYIRVVNEPEEKIIEKGTGIKKLDDRTGEPLENIGFTFMTHIWTYDIVESHTHTFQIKIYETESYSYYVPYTYTDSNGKQQTGYNGPYTGYRSVWKGKTYTASHTHNKCKWVEHEAYLSSRNTWVIDGRDTHLTDINGVAYGYGPIDDSCTHTVSLDVTKGDPGHPSGPFDSAPECAPTVRKRGQFKNPETGEEDKTVIAREVSVPTPEPTENNPTPSPEAEYYGYKENIGKSWTLERKDTIEESRNAELTTATNHQYRIMISGFVWLDEQHGKLSETNGDFDGSETGINGITVYLMQGNSIVKSTTTKEIGIYGEIDGGEYRFYDVDLDTLEAGAYHIEFEYCGVQYQSVPPNIGNNLGSKATDDTSDPNYSRRAIDAKFASVDGNADKSQTLNIQSVRLTYNGRYSYASKLQDHIQGNQYSKLNTHSGCEVRAATGSPTGYYLENNFRTPQKEIKYVNCGLFRKAQTDYALAQDLYKVRVGVNGFQHVYKYATVRYSNDGKNIIDQDTTWNGGVKFQKNNGMYQRAIYEADYNYTNSDKNKEITVYLTYKVTLKNEETYNGRINSVVDYYDSNYEYVTSGFDIDDNSDTITNNISDVSGPEDAENGFKKHTINLYKDIDAGEKVDFYIQFKMNSDAVRTVMNNGSTKNNVMEIRSYTTYDDMDASRPIAVYDQDSVPNTAIPEDSNTYEDDTDAARSLQLVFKDARVITGTAFIDNTGKESNTVYTNQERRGNGIYDQSDTVLPNVAVKLYEVDDSGNKVSGGLEYTDVTGNDGSYQFSDFVAGKYKIEYTWGKGYDGHKVQYYKATIYDSGRYAKTSTDQYWYRGNDPYDSGNGDTATWNDDTQSWTKRYNDALDSHDIRKKIDDEMAAITTNIVEDEINKAYNSSSNKITQTTMTSSTPIIDYSVEYDTNVTYGYIQGNDQATDRVTFVTNNIDFGIVERPKQELDLTKRITGYNITLANGQTLVNAKVDENGKISGTYPYTIDQNPTRQKVQGRYIETYNGLIKTEMDNELIEGAKLETIYTIRVTNIGEKDYTTWNYYDFGIPDDNNMVTISTSELVDYVDGRLQVLDQNWTISNIGHLKDVNASLKEEKDLGALKPYETGFLNVPLRPTETASVTLTTSKLLTSTEDNEFNNTSEITQTKKPDDGVKGTPVHVTWTSDKTYNFNKATAQTVTILPSTGENRDYTTPTIVAIIAITTLGIGTLLIIKYATDRKK